MIVVPDALLVGTALDRSRFDAVGHYARVLNSTTAACCNVGCAARAGYAIFERGTDREQTYDDYSYACDEHLGVLIGHAGVELREGSAHYVIVPMSKD